MSKAQELFQELTDRGIQIEAVGDRLHLVGAITPELVERVRPLKPEF